MIGERKKLMTPVIGDPLGSWIGQALLAQPLLHALQRLIEAGVLTVQLVDDHHPWDAEPLATLPDRLGAHLHAVRGADRDHGAQPAARGVMEILKLIIFPSFPRRRESRF